MICSPYDSPCAAADYETEKAKLQHAFEQILPEKSGFENERRGILRHPISPDNFAGTKARSKSSAVEPAHGSESSCWDQTANRRLSQRSLLVRLGFKELDRTEKEPSLVVVVLFQYPHYPYEIGGAGAFMMRGSGGRKQVRFVALVHD
jgi:hypothetical protein